MTTYQNAVEIAQDKVSKGELTTEQANVLIVQMIGVQIVKKLPAQIRKQLNDAVSRGELAHIKKSGLLPEVYHHVNARARAIETREREMRNAIQSLSKVLV